MQVASKGAACDRLAVVAGIVVPTTGAATKGSVSSMAKAAPLCTGNAAETEAEAQAVYAAGSEGCGQTPGDPNKERVRAIDSLSSREEQDAINLAFLIHDVSRMRRRAYDQLVKPLGVTRSQWWVLAHLSRDDGMMQTRLADVLDVGKASLGDVVGALEKCGWVERRPDPGDGRAKRVYLSGCAHTLIRRMTILEHEFNRQALAGLSASEREQLLHSLRKIKDAIAQLPTGADFFEAET